MKFARTLFTFAPLLATAFALGGCAATPAPPPPPPPAEAAPAVVHVPDGPSPSQRTFSTPDEALLALTTATAAKDEAALRAIFGEQVDELLSGDAEQDAIEAENFAKSVKQLCYPVLIDEDTVVFHVGAENWPFPIPLEKIDGKWYFDTLAGKEEILNRRIGLDELTAIGVCNVYVDAQRLYATEDREGDGVVDYAQKLMSTPGRRDGLYWEPVEYQLYSPLGPLVANARAEGYHHNPENEQRQPFHGYLFNILKTQGVTARGGAYNYVINGHMVAGFALVAYPDHWGESGVMTFIVNQDGQIYETNLGPDSADLGAAMTVFNPDHQWSVINPPDVTVQ